MRRLAAFTVATLAAWSSSGGSVIGAQGPVVPTGLPADIGVAASILQAEDTRTVTPELLALTRHADAAIRARAALALGRVGVPAAQPRLLELLRDTTPEVRALAAFAVGGLEYSLVPAMESAQRTRAGNALAALLGDVPAVARHAAIGLGLAGSGEAELGAWLQAAAVAPGATRAPEVVAAAVEAWWRMPTADVDRIAPYARSPEVAVRRAAAHALRRLSDPNAWPRLLALIEDEDVEVRLHAVRGLHGAPASLAQQRGARFLSARDWREQCAALGWIGAGWRLPETRADDEVFADVLRRTLDRNLHVRRCALSALAAVAHDRAVAEDRLLEALAEPEEGVRATAMLELSGLGAAVAGEAARRVLGRLAGPEGLDTSRLGPAELGPAVGLLEAAGGDTERAILASLLESEDVRVRVLALEAWRRLEPAQAWAVAAAWLDSTVAPLILVAVETLEELAVRGETAGHVPPPAELFEPLWRLYYDPVGPELAAVRAAALPVLMRIDREVMERRAVLLAEQPDRLLRLEAFRLLGDPTESIRGLRAEASALEGHATGLDITDYRRLAQSVLALQQSPPRVTLATSRGAATIQLFPDLAPLTVLQFVDLIGSGFYDRSPFHRVVAGFVAQGGARGQAPWRAPGLRNEDTAVDYLAGAVGLALAGRDTGTSQFFVTTGPAPHLTGRYPLFGELIDGQRAVGRIQPGDLMALELVTEGANSGVSSGPHHGNRESR